MTSGARAARAETDLSLLDLLCQGDPAALETLMGEYAPRVYRLALGICRNEADAEEVVQDVFLTAFRKAATFERRSSLWSWLYRIATNAALMKRRGRRGDLESSLEACLPGWLADGHRDGDPAHVLCDWSETPEEACLRGEARQALERALDGLPPDYRAVLVLRDVEGLSSEEAAEALGETVACVKSRLHRARMALREILTRHFAPRR